MATAIHQPHLEPSAKALRDALAAAGMTISALAKAVGVTGSLISTRLHARSGVREAAARAMAKALKCAWEPLVSLKVRRGRPTGGVRKGAGRPRKPEAVNGAGPATKALALHEASQTLKPVPIPSRPQPLLGFELYDDGSCHIALKATLPAERGAALLRQLLDFGLTGQAPRAGCHRPGNSPLDPAHGDP